VTIVGLCFSVITQPSALFTTCTTAGIDCHAAMALAALRGSPLVQFTGGAGHADAV
jgi:hypothetical protein